MTLGGSRSQNWYKTIGFIWKKIFIRTIDFNTHLFWTCHKDRLPPPSWISIVDEFFIFSEILGNFKTFHRGNFHFSYSNENRRGNTSFFEWNFDINLKSMNFINFKLCPLFQSKSSKMVITFLIFYQFAWNFEYKLMDNMPTYPNYKTIQFQQ